jgi:hypothetical protein
MRTALFVTVLIAVAVVAETVGRSRLLVPAAAMHKLFATAHPVSPAAATLEASVGQRVKLTADLDAGNTVSSWASGQPAVWVDRRVDTVPPSAAAIFAEQSPSPPIVPGVALSIDPDALLDVPTWTGDLAVAAGAFSLPDGRTVPAPAGVTTVRATERRIDSGSLVFLCGQVVSAASGSGLAIAGNPQYPLYVSTRPQSTIESRVTSAAVIWAIVLHTLAASCLFFAARTSYRAWRRRRASAPS